MSNFETVSGGEIQRRNVRATPGAGSSAPSPAFTAKRTRYVSPTGTATATGTRSDPLSQAKAIATRQPGDDIVFLAGTYGPVDMSGDGKPDGTTSARIRIRSDTPLAAQISTSSTSAPAIGRGAGKSFIIQDFDVSGGRNGVQFSMNGTTYGNPSKVIDDIWVIGCRVRNFVEDGIKVNGGTNVYAISNDIIGGNDQNIDFFGIKGGGCWSNVLGDPAALPNPGNLASIVVKAGCSDLTFEDNHCWGKVGLKLGDPVGAGLPFYPGNEGFQAGRITIRSNQLTGVDVALQIGGTVGLTQAGDTLKRAPTDKGPYCTVKSSNDQNGNTVPSSNISLSGLEASRIYVPAGDASTYTLTS